MRNKLVREAIERMEKVICGESFNYDLHTFDLGDAQTILQYIQDLERKLKISDAYNEYMCLVLSDYDGEYDPETKEGSLEGLAELIDYTMELLLKQAAKDDTSPVYFNVLGDYNILNEEVTKDEK